MARTITALLLLAVLPMSLKNVSGLMSYRRVSASYVGLLTERVVGVVPPAGAALVTVTLPDASSVLAGTIEIVKDEAGTAGLTTGGYKLVVQAVGGQPIEGKSSLSLGQFGWRVLYSDGVAWHIIGSG